MSEYFVGPASDRNPYIGPAAFGEVDANLLFGREREAQHLLDLTIVHAEVLLYSPAGAGKTSLLNAALIPMLRSEGFDVLPPVRFGRTHGAIDPGAGTNAHVLDTLLSWEDRGVPTELAMMTLVDYLARRSDSSQKSDLSSPRVAIFDQFEELFTLYPDQWSRRREFIEQVCEALEADPRFRVVFAMREEYIASLDPYQALFPERLRGRYRLERLRREAAMEAVVRPSRAAGLLFETEAAERLVEDLLTINIPSPEGRRVAIGEFVEPVQLQVVCYRLWESASASRSEITMELLMRSGDVDQALSHFYEEAIGAAVRHTGISQGILRGWFDRVLITPLGTRGIVLRDQGTTGGIPNQVVDFLQDMHLVRAEIRGGAFWYELTHDRFIAPIKESNRRWLGLATQKLDGLRQFEGEAGGWDLERQQLLRQLARARLLAILAMLLAGAIGVIAWLLR